MLDARACRGLPGPAVLASTHACSVAGAAVARAARLGAVWRLRQPALCPRRRLFRVGALLGREDDVARVAVVRVVARLVGLHAHGVRRRARRREPLVPRHALVGADTSDGGDAAAEQGPPPPPRDLVEEEGV